MTANLVRIRQRRRARRMRMLATGIVGSVVAAVAVVWTTQRYGAADQVVSELYAHPTPAEDSTLYPVNMLGDSITQLAAPSLEAAFVANGWPSTVRGFWGTTIAQTTEQLSAAARGNPRAVVVELGTNDVIAAAANAANDRVVRDRLEVVKSDLLAALDMTQESNCVVWINLNDWSVLPSVDFRTVGSWFNAQLDQLQSRYPNLHVLDFASAFRPDTPERAAWMAQNFDAALVHPVTGEAQLRLAQMIASLVSRFCGI